MFEIHIRSTQTEMEEEVAAGEAVRGGHQTDPLIALDGNPPFWLEFKSHFSATDDD